MNAAMPTKLAEEIALYEAKRAEFVAQHTDEFVLIKGTEVVGFYATELDALRAGHERFGNAAFLVRRVAENESPVFLTSLHVAVLQ